METTSHSHLGACEPSTKPYHWLNTDAGAGAFGCVRLATCSSTKETVAIKCVKLACITESTLQEVRNHRSLQHPYVIKYKDAFTTRQHLCIVMEYARQGTLFDCVKQFGRLPEAYARWFFQQLVLGLDYCHKRGVVHRDISPLNLLLQQEDGLPLPVLKICDFGLSRDTRAGRHTHGSRVGTPAFMAPEVLLGVAGRDERLADIWSAGVCLYFMLTGKLPFEHELPTADNGHATVKAVLAPALRFTFPGFGPPGCVGNISETCEDLLCRLMAEDPYQRISMEELLEHAWFKANLPPELEFLNERCLSGSCS